MNCPTCKAEMEEGVLQAGAMIIWTPKPHKILLLPRRDGKDIVLAEKNYLTGPKAKAYCCRNCGYVLSLIPPSNETMYG
jgi:hypothetical protein